MSTSLSVLSFIKTVASSFLPIVVTAWFAMWQFNSQKKWERRAKDYDHLFSIIIELRNCYDYAESYTEDVFSGEVVNRSKPDWSRINQIESDLGVRYALSDVYLGSKAKACLANYFRRKEGIERNYHECETYEFEIYRSEANIAKMLIDELKPIAASDLKIRDKRFLFF